MKSVPFCLGVRTLSSRPHASNPPNKNPKNCVNEYAKNLKNENPGYRFIR